MTTAAANGDTMKLPFEPESVTVPNLDERLSTIDSQEIVHALQKADTRTSAAAHYERRIAALQEALGDVTDEDRERGYRVTKWAVKHDNFECLECPYKTLDREKIEHHVKAH